MAKKITLPEEANEVENMVSEELTVTEGSVQEEIADEVAEEVAPAPKKEPKSKKNSPAEPDDTVRRILKSFPDYEALYISSFGAVFTPDTKPALTRGAILYKNPYFKK